MFQDPNDRTVKGTMFGHPSIEATIQGVVFSGLLADGMQHPEVFDDTLPVGYDSDDDGQPPHKPTFSLVTIAVAITGVRVFLCWCASFLRWYSGTRRYYGIFKRPLGAREILSQNIQALLRRGAQDTAGLAHIPLQSDED